VPAEVTDLLVLREGFAADRSGDLLGVRQLRV